MDRKSQSSFEMLVAFVVAIIILTPVVAHILTLQTNYADSYKVSAAESAVNKLAEAADSIYLQGSPAKITVKLQFPEGIVETRIKNNEILIRLSTSAGITDIFQITKEPVVGSLPIQSGLHKISVESKGDFVKIS